jgi:hypothetical protein
MPQLRLPRAALAIVIASLTASCTDDPDPGPGPGPDTEALCATGELPGPQPRLVRLTHAQYDNTVRDLLGLPDLAPSADFLDDPDVRGVRQQRRRARGAASARAGLPARGRGALRARRRPRDDGQPRAVRGGGRRRRLRARVRRVLRAASVPPAAHRAGGSTPTSPSMGEAPASSAPERPSSKASATWSRRSSSPPTSCTGWSCPRARLRPAHPASPASRSRRASRT